MPAKFEPGEVVEGFVGIDGGSTSTKAVLLDKDKNVLAKPTSFPRAIPSKTRRRCSPSCEQQIDDQGATLKMLGVGTTGYAKDILKDVIGADAALVETVAHTEAGLHFYDDVDVICDVGGQDIKIIILKNGRVKDFKLNTQCSAGNGYFLQSTARASASTSRSTPTRPSAPRVCPSSATAAPCSCSPTSWTSSGRAGSRKRSWPGCATCCRRTSGCTFRRSPTCFARHELPAAGRHAVQPGGGEGQVDFIESRFQGKDIKPDVIVHEHCGEAGAIGAALEADACGTTAGRPPSSAWMPCRDQYRPPQRRHALLLLQEQVPAHLHRRQTMPGVHVESSV